LQALGVAFFGLAEGIDATSRSPRSPSSTGGKRVYRDPSCRSRRARVPLGTT